MNAKVKKLKKQLERAGGVVFVPDHLPDDVAEMFVRGIMNCPDCVRAIAESSKQSGSRKEH